MIFGGVIINLLVKRSMVKKIAIKVKVKMNKIIIR